MDEELRRRVEALERENRRWKVIGITSLAVLGLAFCLACPLSVGTALLRVRQVRALEVERVAVERERQAAEQAREQAEMARQEAERRLNQTGQKNRQTEK